MRPDYESEIVETRDTQMLEAAAALLAEKM